MKSVERVVAGQGLRQQVEPYRRARVQRGQRRRRYHPMPAPRAARARADVEKTIASSAVHVAVTSPAAAAMVSAAPPAIGMRRSSPLATNPSDRPSGEKNGDVPSVPANQRRFERPAGRGGTARSSRRGARHIRASGRRVTRRRAAASRSRHVAGRQRHREPRHRLRHRLGPAHRLQQERRERRAPPSPAANAAIDGGRRAAGSSAGSAASSSSRIASRDAPTAAGRCAFPDDRRSSRRIDAGVSTGSRLNRGLALDDVAEHLGGGPPGERARAGQHLEHHAAERPDVGALVDRFGARLLRAHVGRGAEQHAGRRRRSGRASRYRQRPARAPCPGRNRAPSARAPLRPRRDRRAVGAG